MTPGRPGDGSYQDPYGENPYGEDPYGEDPYGESPYGRESYGRDGHAPDAYGQDAYQDAYGQDPYGVRGTYEEGAYGGQSYGGESYGENYGQSAWEPDSYTRPDGRQGGGYQAAVDSLTDPLTDPLPASGPPQPGQREDQPSPWFRPAREPGRPAESGQQPAQPRHGGPPQQHQQHQVPQHQTQHPQTQYPQAQHPQAQPGLPQPRGQQPPRPAAHRAPADPGETVAMPALDATAEPTAPRHRAPAAGSEPDSADSAATPADTAAKPSDGAADERGTVALRRPSEEELGGRAARRRAAAGKGRGRGRRAAGPAPATPNRPMTRLEARRAERAAKDGPVVLLSRAIGEVFITCGVLMLLFVAYQLWWTNILATNYAGGAKDSLTQKWEENPERKPGQFSPGQGFAIMYIPKLDVVVPVAEGIDKQSVLDNGLVGHYDKESGLETAMPWDKKGNFGVAGHRNTHGEPFRYINRLVAGDKIVVETAEKYYVYEMYSRLPSTSPSNVSVLEPVPPQSGFEKPGRYITLTTCTPEFTSKYRLIVWGRMVDERPRSEGKPDALVE